MNPLARYWRFNLVGAMGVAVQLAALAMIDRRVPGHCLYASAAAVEMAVLHNFVWHVRYTWRDRRAGAAVLTQLMRFHLSNGMVSIAGNLALMRVLVRGAHVPLLAANGIAIVCCSIVNFCLAESWAFAWPCGRRSVLRDAGTGRLLGCLRRRTLDVEEIVDAEDARS